MMIWVINNFKRFMSFLTLPPGAFISEVHCGDVFIEIPPAKNGIVNSPYPFHYRKLEKSALGVWRTTNVTISSWLPRNQF